MVPELGDIGSTLGPNQPPVQWVLGVLEGLMTLHCVRRDEDD